MFLFNNSITNKVEKRNKIQGKIELLKKQQKLETEKTIKEYESKKTNLKNNYQANIDSLKARIKSLEDESKAKIEIYDEEKKVVLDRVTKAYDQKIICQQNKVKKLNHYIEAEQKNMVEVANDIPQPNAPTTKILLESDKTKNK